MKVNKIPLKKYNRKVRQERLPACRALRQAGKGSQRSLRSFANFAVKNVGRMRLRIYSSYFRCTTIVIACTMSLGLAGCSRNGERPLAKVLDKSILAEEFTDRYKAYLSAMGGR